jgi:hypothetical protein
LCVDAAHPGAQVVQLALQHGHLRLALSQLLLQRGRRPGVGGSRALIGELGGVGRVGTVTLGPVCEEERPVPRSREARAGTSRASEQARSKESFAQRPPKKRAGPRADPGTRSPPGKPTRPALLVAFAGRRPHGLCCTSRRLLGV